MPTRRLFALVLAGLASLPATGSAYVQADGYLIAEESCAAVQSIRKGTNPGDESLAPATAYHVLGKNRDDATHWHVRIEGANPKERWVPVSCGIHVVAAAGCGAGGAPPSVASNGETAREPGEPEYLLALSWQPAFCQGHQNKEECRTQTMERFDAANLTLHGLWPQPRGNAYCDVEGRDKALDRAGAWAQLPALGLTDATYLKLIERMPGVASYLQRHEWTKHGSCYGSSPEEYFLESMALQEQVNDSPVGELFASRIGDSLSAAEIRAGFDNAFGESAGDKVQVLCSDGMITELRINLRGEIEADTSLASLLADAPDARHDCGEGMVDRVGF